MSDKGLRVAQKHRSMKSCSLLLQSNVAALPLAIRSSLSGCPRERRPSKTGLEGGFQVTNKPRNQRRIRVRGIKRAKPDLRKLSKALILLAAAQAEKEAETEHRRRQRQRSPRGQA